MTNSALLLSGGIDSTAIAFWKRPRICITIDYGQLAAQAEIDAAAQVAKAISLEHRVLTVDCRSFGAGDLAGKAPSELNRFPEWWPYRNQLLVTIAAMAVGLEVEDILIGTVSTDDRHRDGTPEFVRMMSALLTLQEGAVRLEAPAIGLTTVDLLRQSRVPREILSWAHSCHRGTLPCLDCCGCNKYVGVLAEFDRSDISGLP